MSPRAAVLALSVLALFGALAGPAWAGVAKHETGQSRAEVVRYWTKERMRNAIPVERGRSDGPRGLPGNGKGGGGGKPGGGEPKPGASQAVPSNAYPSAHGKVFFSDGTWNYVCSGTAVTSQNESVVWTAGHCVNEGGTSAGAGAFYQNWMFVPAYQDGNAPYGEFTATQLETTSGWEASTEWGVDVGAATVGTNGTDTLADAVDERGIVFGSPRNQTYSAYGYPAAKKFDGQHMRVCTEAPTWEDPNSDPAAMGIPCDMTGGSSGGGWVTGTGQVASVVSFGYNSLKNVLFGPYQEDEGEAEDLWRAAEAP